MASESKKISRREFLNRSTRTAAGVVAASALASCAKPQITYAPASCVRGASERINMAVIGVRGRGGGLAKNFAKIPNVRVKTLCDIDERLYAERVKQVAANQDFTPETEYDLRRVFEDKEIDAVATATPNHWHALVTIWACQAGKHVYVEKPCSHNIFEGRKMIEATRKYNRIVCVGFQSRSSRNVLQAMKFIHDGGLGEIYMAKGLCYKLRDGWKVVPDSPVPAGVHYDLWLGPADYQRFNENRFHYKWHWFWNTGNGDIGNQGVHQMDVARWGINKNEHPVKINCSGGYFGFPHCDQQTANTQIAAFEYADGKILQFEVRGRHTNDECRHTNDEKGVRIGNLFFGTKGWMCLNSSGDTWQTFFGRKNEPGPTSAGAEAGADPSDLAGAGGEAHFVNFINALRSGRPEDIPADIEGGHLSAALCHMANISYRLGRKLTFDGAREKFVGDRQANRMLTRKYRKHFVVPERV